ncbi:HAD family hydrolase [Actinomadura sp. SCN-SB]|uniref:HAD family hydrolase n=1 Tax=Actinomadura sp. SCN-SB TaxID=3373092 RepID=UPI003751C3D0
MSPDPAAFQPGDMTPMPACLGPISTVAVDYGGSISTDQIDPALGQKPVDPEAAAALGRLHRLGKRLILASNNRPEETRWPALRRAGIADLFHDVLLSATLGVAKPDPLFYRRVIAAAQCPADQILFVGDHLDKDVRAPLTHGMHAALIRPNGLGPHEELPDGALLVGHVRELPALLRTSGPVAT